MSRLRKFLVTQKNVNRVSSDESSIKVETNVDQDTYYCESNKF